MCFSAPPSTSATLPAASQGPAYTSSQLNRTTHLIIHNDKYSESPFIYVKCFPHLSIAAVIDTGCGAHNALDGRPRQELRDFILSDESGILGKGSNQVAAGNVHFLIICSHCHYDHIGGIEAFAKSGASIIASAYCPTFLDPKQLPENSLCAAFDTMTPSYNITHFAHDGERLHHGGDDLGLRVLQIPGHTPDSMAIYDEQERWLFVGDTCYARFPIADGDNGTPSPEHQEPDCAGVPVLLPQQGNWVDFNASLHKLLDFVVQIEREQAKQTGCETASFSAQSSGSRNYIRLAAGHTTSHGCAALLLRDLIAFCEQVKEGNVPVYARMRGDEIAPMGSFGHEMFCFWLGGEGHSFNLLMPERIMEEF